MVTLVRTLTRPWVCVLLYAAVGLVVGRLTYGLPLVVELSVMTATALASGVGLAWLVTRLAARYSVTSHVCSMEITGRSAPYGVAHEHWRVTHWVDGQVERKPLPVE